MNSKITLFIASVMLVAGCAKPTYVQSTSPVIGDISKSAADCTLHFTKSQNCLSYQWRTLPQDTSVQGLMWVKVFRPNQLDQSAVPIDFDGELHVDLQMPSMGHGSAPTSSAKMDIGSYQISDIFFVMPGEWVIKFQIFKNGLLDDEIVVPYTHQ